MAELRKKTDAMVKKVRIGCFYPGKNVGWRVMENIETLKRVARSHHLIVVDLLLMLDSRLQWSRSGRDSWWKHAAVLMIS